ncbi:MAG: hypothetical protein J1E97_05920 [Muribaculaceae bacterium]|nr:hypothetical protein [Muribaculaceae bacterium]
MSKESQKIKRSRKAIENTAAFGMIIMAVGLLAPFTDLTNMDYLRFFKWIYSAGALIFTVARIVGSTDPDESLRLRRLRRMEFWSGVAFCFGAFFWFYNEHRYASFLLVGAGSWTALQETIYFALAGAVIQVTAAFMLSRQIKKENK